MESWPFNKEVISGRRHINPMASMPAEQYDRSIDPPSTPTGSGGGAPFMPPLWLYAQDSTHLQVKFGQVNGITPSGGWAGGGNDVGVNVDISGYAYGTYNVYVHCTLAATGLPSAVEVLANTSAVPADDSNNSYRLIGTAVVASGVAGTISPSMAWSQEFVTCGRDSADPTTTPGTYFWELA